MDIDVAYTHHSPYLLDNQPASTGKIFLARGFEHYCALHQGFSGSEIGAAFEASRDRPDRISVDMAARLFGGLFAEGRIRTWTRPFGGGEIAELGASSWELDDFSWRFATSAIDPRNPFDRKANLTHWVFADLAQWNDVVAASVGDVSGAVARARVPVKNQPANSPISNTSTAREQENRLLRLPEVKHLTGMSRSTIYRRMGQGIFPRTVTIGGNISVWREEDIIRWLLNPN